MLPDVEALVRERFQVYEVRREPQGLAFFVEMTTDFEPAFESLRGALKPLSLVPMLVRDGAETVLLVMTAPPPARTRIGLAGLLYAATWVTTTLAGSWAVFSYRNADLCIPCLGEAATPLAFSPEYLVWGFLQFALPLMAILTVHEAGHYVTSRMHGLRPSLPFFIPVPPFFALNIGTMGAFITLRDPIPSRKALFDIGASGPLAGLAVAIPLAILGLALMASNPVPVLHAEDTIQLGNPILFLLLELPFSVPGDAFIHPIALAAWVGLLVTGLNLLPIGQLDGGHVATALFGTTARTLSLVGLGALILLGLGIPPFSPTPWLEGYPGWLLFALLLSFLGTEHPPTLNGISEIRGWRRGLAGATLLIGLLSFVPVPISL